jgi:hypothetical protein
MKIRNRWFKTSTFRPSGLENGKKLAVRRKDEWPTGF